MKYKYYKESDKHICPKCGNILLGYPAVSRRDNKTFICSDCGVFEAMEDFIKYTERNNDDETSDGKNK